MTIEFLDVKGIGHQKYNEFTPPKREWKCQVWDWPRRQFFWVKHKTTRLYHVAVVNGVCSTNYSDIWWHAADLKSSTGMSSVAPSPWVMENWVTWVERAIMLYTWGGRSPGPREVGQVMGRSLLFITREAPPSQRPTQTDRPPPNWNLPL